MTFSELMNKLKAYEWRYFMSKGQIHFDSLVVNVYNMDNMYDQKQGKLYVGTVFTGTFRIKDKKWEIIESPWI